MLVMLTVMTKMRIVMMSMMSITIKKYIYIVKPPVDIRAFIQLENIC